MNRLQKFAYYNISVITITIIALIACSYLIGPYSLEGFTPLVLLALSPFLFRTRPGEPAVDEKDAQTYRKSLMSALWLSVAVCLALVMATPYYYGDDGAVPVPVAQYATVGVCMLFVTAHALATLYRYHWGK